MDFIVELILTIFAEGAEAGIKSKKTPLAAKVVLFSLVVFLPIGLFVLISVLSYKSGVIFSTVMCGAIAAAFVGVLVFGLIRIIKAHKKYKASLKNEAEEQQGENISEIS